MTTPQREAADTGTGVLLSGDSQDVSLSSSSATASDKRSYLRSSRFTSDHTCHELPDLRLNSQAVSREPQRWEATECKHFQVSVLHSNSSFFDDCILPPPLTFVHQRLYFLLLALERHTLCFCVETAQILFKVFDLSLIFERKFLGLELFELCCCAECKCEWYSGGRLLHSATALGSLFNLLCVQKNYLT